MSSFYGSYCGTSGSANGTSDYNDLLNKPFTNIVGTLSSPIVLNNLDYGNYMLKGSFIYTSKDKDIKSVSYQNYIEIVQDAVSLKKVAKYETFEDGKFYIYSIYFNDDNTCLLDKMSISKSEGTIFLNEEDLPEEGIESILYVTELAIYQWKNGEWVNMRDPLWATL
jgi:hypothetical protein